MNSSGNDRSLLVEIVLSNLRRILDEKEGVPACGITEDTALVGPEQVLDSLGLVTLIVDVEQEVEEKLERTLGLADDRAMSRRNSPFRTVASFVDYIGERLREPE